MQEKQKGKAVALHIPAKGNAKLGAVLERVQKNEHLAAHWKAANIVAVDRMGYNDHGATHVDIVAGLALRLYRLLTPHRTPGVAQHGLGKEDGEVVVVLAALFHDLGHIVHRTGHAHFSIPLAVPFIDDALQGLYSDSQRARMKADTLHAMIAHETRFKPLTLEAACVRIADALDMEEGRARIPFKAGKVDIHSVSALAIRRVRVSPGKEKPVLVRIDMTNSAGIFQVDGLLKEKIHGTGLESLIDVVARVQGEEKKIVHAFRFPSPHPPQP